MKLSDKEATILASAELRADAPIEILRKESGYREHTVRYAIRSLLNRNVIAPVPFINLHRLGFTIYSIFFSVGADRKDAKDSALKTLIGSPDVLWVGEFGGEYQYAVGFCTKRLPPFVEFLNTISKKHPNMFFEKAISIQISSTMYPRKYLSSKKFSHTPLTVTFGKEVVEIDDLDAKVLSGLTSHAELSHRQLALQLQMPLSTLELRLKKLTERKVIVGNVYNVDSSSFGMQSFKLLVYTKGLDPQLTSQMHQFCGPHRDITYLIECLGLWGYEIGVEVARPEDVSLVVQEIYERFGNSINTVRTLTKFRYPKVRWFPDLRTKGM